MIKKELLFSDLCGRIPYKVKVSIDGGRPVTLTFGDLDAEAYNTSLDDSVRIKPYLRLISSMTEEEINEFILISDTVLWLGSKRSTCILSLEQIDWLNAHHFDYRDLIGKGLAIEAPDGMYGAESGIPKDPNILEIKDEFDKDEVMGVLGAVYDFWKAKETRNVRNGCGRSGLDGMMTVDVWRLFNQMLVVLSRASAHVESDDDDDEDCDTVDCEVYGEPDTSYKCSCGADLVSEGVVLTSNPPQYPYLCPKCGKRYVYGPSGRYSWDEVSDGSCDNITYTFSTNGNSTISVTATDGSVDWHTTI